MSTSTSTSMSTKLAKAEKADKDACDAVQDKQFFSFPYEPYDIQLQLMQQLYATIDRQHVGIFESPTGTGKSISLICGALSWLTKHTDEYGLLCSTSTAEAATAAAGATDDAKEESSRQQEPSWLAAFDQTNAQRIEQQQQAKAKDALKGVEKIRSEPSENTKKRKIGFAYNHQEKKRQHHVIPSRGAGSSSNASTEEGEEHLVDAYDSDRGSAHQHPSSGSDSDAAKPASRIGYGTSDEQADLGVMKIIYCSRTHSQISQFVREIRKTAFGEHVRVVSLGSRKNLCTNPSVSALPSDLQMTDKCLDMLQGSKSKAKDTQKKKKAAKCPFYEKELLGHYKDYALAHVHDIEDLHELGNEMSICSYYGTRESIPLAQVVAMPYAMLLSKDTRESLGIELEGNIVIFDEAHNIVEAVNSTYTVEVTSKQLVVARRSLWSYFKKYEKRFKGKNSFYIKQLLSILELLTKFLRAMSKSKSSPSSSNGGVNDEEGEDSGAKMMLINDFLFSAKVDHFNMFKIIQYLSESGLAKKLLGFMDAENSNSTQNPVSIVPKSSFEDEVFESRHISPLRAIEALLKALTSAGGDGRILAQPQNVGKGVEGAIKFILMNPAVHFEEIVQKARSVILAGGTMQPVSQVIDQLFSFIPEDHIDLFSCGHVIPPQNLVGFSLSSGPSQKHLEFTFARRSDTEALDELGRILLNLTRIVPGGIVVFFPSYRFEETAVRRWQVTKQLDDINARKRLFREPKQSEELANVLAKYSAACSTKYGSSAGETEASTTPNAKQASSSSGAVLLSVVGGKMSEGINFSDELARCVVMVGLPYPNARDAELVEKMTFLDKRNPGSGRQYYESLCMKAVNQSIGRSIRHQRDYASIVLVDHRYASSIVRKRLPEWIQERVQPPTPSFGQVYSQLVHFYRSKEKSALAYD